jgi:hypothetical protein
MAPSEGSGVHSDPYVAAPSIARRSVKAHPLVHAGQPYRGFRRHKKHTLYAT